MTLSTITNREESFAVNNMNVTLKLFKGEYTRETSTQLCISALVQRGEDITIDKIDDLSFISYNFPVSHRKGKPAKNTGGLSVKKRIDRYTYNSPCMNYNIDSDTFTIDDSILNLIDSIQKKKARKKFLFNLNQNRLTHDTKNKSFYSCKNKISNMLFLHLTQSGKFAY